MRRYRFFFLCNLAAALELAAQTAVDVPRAEEKQKQEQAVAKEQEKHAQATTTVEFSGEQAFKEKDLRSAVKEQLATVDRYGLTPARADDLAFFVEVFYRKHGYTKASVHYKIENRDRLRLEINEGPLMTRGTITFEGNSAEPTDKVFDFVVGPTRERYSKLQRRLPFVATDVQEGAELVHRLYVAEGFLDAAVDQPRYTFHDEASRVDVTIPIHEGRRYFFGNVSFHGETIYGADALRGQIDDLLKQPFTDARVADIPRRLQAYFRTRGYYEVKVEATAEPTAAVNARIPVDVAISPGQLYHFSGEVFVKILACSTPPSVSETGRPRLPLITTAIRNSKSAIASNSAGRSPNNTRQVWSSPSVTSRSRKPPLPAGFSATRLISQIRSGSFKRSTCAKVRWSRRVAC